MLLLGACTRTLVLTTESDGETGSVDTPAGEAVCVPREAMGYRLPTARWGLAAAHASHRLSDSGWPLDLSPSWFLAVGWQTTRFGCFEYGDPWSLDPEWTGDEGCLGLFEGTHWAEVEKLYPGIYDMGFAGFLQGDTPERSAMTLAWTLVAAHSLWGRDEIGVSVTAWYEASQDPRGAERMSALLHAQGPWSDDAAAAVRDCPDAITDCIDDWTRPRVDGVIDKLEILEEAACYELPLSEDDVRAHVVALSEMWPDLDWEAAEAAAVAELDGSGFHLEAPRVIAAIDTFIDTRLVCPEQALWQVYSFSCP